MSIKYKLHKDLIGRAAAQLVYELKSLMSSINIISNVAVNAKSLVGLLSGGFRKDDIITIRFDREEDYDSICSFFDEIGEKIT